MFCNSISNLTQYLTAHKRSEEQFENIDIDIRHRFPVMRHQYGSSSKSWCPHTQWVNFILMDYGERQGSTWWKVKVSNCRCPAAVRRQQSGFSSWTWRPRPRWGGTWTWSRELQLRGHATPVRFDMFVIVCDMKKHIGHIALRVQFDWLAQYYDDGENGEMTRWRFLGE